MVKTVLIWSIISCYAEVSTKACTVSGLTRSGWPNCPALGSSTYTSAWRCWPKSWLSQNPTPQSPLFTTKCMKTSWRRWTPLTMESTKLILIQGFFNKICYFYKCNYLFLYYYLCLSPSLFLSSVFLLFVCLYVVLFIFYFILYTYDFSFGLCVVFVLHQTLFIYFCSFIILKKK